MDIDTLSPAFQHVNKLDFPSVILEVYHIQVRIIWMLLRSHFEARVEHEANTHTTVKRFYVSLKSVKAIF